MNKEEVSKIMKDKAENAKSLNDVEVKEATAKKLADELSEATGTIGGPLGRVFIYSATKKSHPSKKAARIKRKTIKKSRCINRKKK